MRYALRLSFISIIVILCSCETTITSLQPNAGWLRETELAWNAHRTAIQSNPALDPIRGKVAFVRARDITFEMLSNTAYPNEAERAAILELAKLREIAYDQYLSIDDRYQPPYGRVYQAHRQATNALWADLYRGRITFAQFSRNFQELDAAVGETLERLRNLAAAEASREEQLALQRIMAYRPARQPTMIQQPRLQTTCTTVGNTMYCY